MARIQYRGLKILLFFALLGLFDPHQVLAKSCEPLLSPPLKWHVVGEHYGKNSTYRAAKKRFGIKSDPNKDPREEVSDFFHQIDKRYFLALEDELELEKLRSEWLELALIKEVPKSHINHLKAIARRNGREADFEYDFDEEQELKTLKEEQQESFLRWFDYIMGPDVEISPWLRHILLKDLLEIGTYNRDKKGFAQRTRETVGPYPGLNSEAFAKVYDSLENYYKGRVDSIKEGLLKVIKKNERRAFAILYAQRLNELEKLSIRFDPNETNGEWVKYERGNEAHAKALFDSLQNQNTGWCTANACSMATSQVEGGDFYVYYSKDVKGEFKIPRIAIRMKAKSIAEVRGRAKDQHLDSEMLKTSILEDKLKEFGDEGEKYKQKYEDMKLLTEVEFKVQRGEELSLKELKFLYEIERKIQGFGYVKDPRIDEIISQRDKKNKDYALIFKVRESKVTSKKEDVLSGEAKIFVGNLKLEAEDDLSRVRLETITGSANFYNLKSAKGLGNLSYIGGDAYFNNLTSAKGLEHLSHIGNYAFFNNLTSAEGLEHLSHIGGSAFFNNLKSAKGLEHLSHIGGGANFYNLKSAKGLGNLSHIGEDAYFNNLTSAEGLEHLSHIGGGAFFQSLTSAEGLEHLSHIGGDANFRSLTSAKGLGNLSHIGEDAYFDSLTSAEGLVSLKYVGGNAYFESLTSAEGLGSLKYVGGNAYFDSLTSAEVKGLLENLYIRGDTIFKK